MRRRYARICAARWPDNHQNYSQNERHALVYKHQGIFEARFSPRSFLTINFTYVPKCLYTSTSAFLKLACLPNMSLRWTLHMCPNACIYAPANLWSLPVSQQYLYYKLHIRAQMLVYMHQQIFEACRSSRTFLTMNFPYVSKCLYTSTIAFLKLAGLPKASLQ